MRLVRLGTALADDGHREYDYEPASDGPPLGERRSEPRAMIGAAAEAGADRLTLVGASRGGYLSLIEAASNPDVAAVAVLSCARAWNQDDPEPLTPYLPKVRVPVLEVVVAADDPDVPIAGVRKDLDVLADGDLLQVPGSDHGSARGALPQVRTRLAEFVGKG